MGFRLFRTLVTALLITGLASTLAKAQGSFFTSLSGTVVDSSGAVIPGADVKIKNNGTGAEFNVVSASDGGFTVNGLSGGSYSVTVSLLGFKTAVLNSVVLNAAVPASVKVTLSVGALEESVNVVGDSALVVQTQSPSISTCRSIRPTTAIRRSRRPVSMASRASAMCSSQGAEAERGRALFSIPRARTHITPTGTTSRRAPASRGSSRDRAARSRG
jgi:hypothetical protein